ncbi:hypothetical protein QWM81_26120 [Streptomyces ficellus]|uniref:ABC transporter permease n=1 Tax=Streptomyces ficellus TaxID=1977088 RepID=A0ABT7ZD60_9ACTN|nr:hypothetical protein [Streptomyces ficellus]MDN3297452.1 hypothetical protein [Streptomyces ficellus]
MASWGQATRKVHNLWSEHPSVDWLAAALCVSVLGFWQHGHVLSGHSLDQRMSVYATVASVAAIIGGFGTAAISQYATSSGRRMTFLRARFGESLRRNWVSILTSMTAVSAGLLAVMLGDTGKTVGWPGWLVGFLLFLGLLRSVRLIWLFRLLIDVADHDGTTTNNNEPVRIVD